MPEPEAHRSIPSRRPGIASALGVVVLAGRIAVTMAAVPAPALAADLVIGAAAGGLTVDGDVGEWQDKPPSLLLQPTAGTGRGGRVWLAESEDGLIVAGLVDGPPPRFVAKGEDPGGADRVELSVAMAEPKLPKIGWTEASAPVVVAAAEDCAHVESLAEDTNGIADCEAWVREQADYRRHLLDLFARHWRLAPGVGEEDLASRAFAALPPALRDGLTPLAPKGAPIARFMVPRDSGYSFEILVPWDQLPPSAGLELSRLRLLVDAVMPGPPASPKGPRGEAAAGAAKAAMLPARLEPPRRWRLSRCGYPLGGFDTDGGTTTPAPAFFTPAAGAEIGRIFIADNPVVAYSPPPDDNSPVITPMTFFSQELAPDLSVCGPPLAVRRGTATTFVADAWVSPGLKVHPVKDGWLVADGPYADDGGRYANDECAGCRMISLRIFFIAAAGGDPVTAFDDAWLIDDEAAAGPISGPTARVALKPDFTAIDAYEADVDEERGRVEWTHVRHCYDAEAHSFRECGHFAKAPPPAGLALPPEPPS